MVTLIGPCSGALKASKPLTLSQWGKNVMNSNLNVFKFDFVNFFSVRVKLDTKTEIIDETV